MAQVELDIAASPTHVRTVRQVAVTLARRAGLAEEALDDVRLAVGEACQLSIPVARSDAGRLTIRFDDDAGLTVAVHATGRLEAAEGPAAADALVAVADPQAGAEDTLGAQTTLAVLGTVTPQLQVRTGSDGVLLAMRWPA